MSFSIDIRKNATGEVRTYKFNFDWEDHTFFWLTEGNFGCDCNRHLEFERAGGERGPNDIEDTHCSEGRYTILHATLPDGSRIPIDGATESETDERL